MGIAFQRSRPEARIVAAAVDRCGMASGAQAGFRMHVIAAVEQFISGVVGKELNIAIGAEGRQGKGHRVIITAQRDGRQDKRRIPLIVFEVVVAAVAVVVDPQTAVVVNAVLGDVDGVRPDIPDPFSQVIGNGIARYRNGLVAVAGPEPDAVPVAGPGVVGDRVIGNGKI